MIKRAFKAIALLVVLAFTTAAEAQQFESGGIAYNVLSATDQTVEVISPLSCSYYSGSINIPASVTYDGITYDVVALGNRAFYGATLSSVTIPSSVTQIKSQCFLFATGLPPAVVGEGPLEQIGGIGRIYVPCDYWAEWTGHIYWGQYADKMEVDCGGIDNTEADDLKVYTLGGRIIVEGAEGEAVRIFDITGHSIRNNSLPAGVYLVKIGDRPARKVVVMK